MRLPATAALLLLLLLSAALAGCTQRTDEGGREGDGGDGGGVSATSSGTTSTSRPAETRFAVLIADGQLTAKGPEAQPGAVCDLAPPDGRIDFDGEAAWAQPGSHSFRKGATWIVVMDRVRLADPRDDGCRVPAAAIPFDTVEAAWTPRMEGVGFHYVVERGTANEIHVGGQPHPPESAWKQPVEFQDGDYTVTGNVTFTHAGWFDMAAFSERSQEPQGYATVWWS